MAGELILIVEDNEKNMKLARDVLQFNGFQTLEAESAEAALSLLKEHRPVLVLMDIQLPGMSGIEALQQLRGNPATSALRIVALTASAMKEDEARIIAAGFDGYMTKPLDIRTFPEKVRELCDGRA